MSWTKSCLRWLLLITIAAACLTLTPKHALANLQKSQEAYRKANELYDQKRYREALRWFENSYKNLGPTGHDFARNELRYFLGICHYQLGNFRKALVFLETYITNNTTPERKKEVQTTIKKIKAKLKKDSRDPPPKPTGPKYSPPAAAFVLLGLGAAVLVGGAVTGVMASGNMAEAQKKFEERQPDAQAKDISALANAAQSQAAISNTLWGAGAALLLGGGTMLLSKSTKIEPKDRRPLWLGLSADGALALQGENHRVRASLFAGYRFLTFFSGESGLGIELQGGAAFGASLLHIEGLLGPRLDIPMNLTGIPLGFFARFGAGAQFANSQTCSSQNEACEPITGLRFAMRVSAGFRFTFGKRVNILFEPVAFSIAWGKRQTVAYSLLLGVELIL